MKVYNRLQVGVGNTDFFVNKAISVDLNTRNLVYAYDISNRVTLITEKDGGSTVKITAFTYDGSNRVATAAESTTEGTLTSTYTYVGITFEISTVTRVVT